MAGESLHEIDIIIGPAEMRDAVDGDADPA
jgi:hypothetical protein